MQLLAEFPEVDFKRLLAISEHIYFLRELLVVLLRGFRRRLEFTELRLVLF